MINKIFFEFLLLGAALSIFLSPASYAEPLSETALCNINVKDYNAKGDSTTDDTAAIQAAISAATFLDKPTICFPGSSGYKITNTIVVPPSISLTMNGPLLFAGNNSTPALVIGDANVSNTNVILQISVKKTSQSDWLDEASVGVKLYNLHSSKVHIRRSELFTIGVQAIGVNGKGFGYNQVELGWITGNKIGLDLTNLNGGWANENIFINGRFGQYSIPNVPSGRIGIRITSSDEIYTNNNNNLFIKPAFELWDEYAGDGEAIPILIEHGLFNRFESCRNEKNSNTFARVLNNSRANEFDIGYGGIGEIDDKSSQPSSYAVARMNRILSSVSAPAFLSGNLAKLAEPYDPSGAVHIPGVHATNSTGIILKAINDIVIEDKYVEIPWPKGVGIFVDTSQQKQLVIRKETVSGFGGRVAIRAYNSSDEILDGSSASPAYVSGNQPYYWSNGFLGVYLLSADSDKDFYLQLREEVDKIDLLFLGGTTNPLRLKSFTISALDSGAPSTWSGYKSGTPNANLATTTPTHECELGQITYNAEPESGEAVGWVCTISGNWSSFGTIN